MLAILLVGVSHCYGIAFGGMWYDQTMGNYLVGSRLRASGSGVYCSGVSVHYGGRMLGIQFGGAWPNYSMNSLPIGSRSKNSDKTSAPCSGVWSSYGGRKLGILLGDDWDGDTYDHWNPGPRSRHCHSLAICSWIALHNGRRVTGIQIGGPWNENSSTAKYVGSRCKISSNGGYCSSAQPFQGGR